MWVRLPFMQRSAVRAGWQADTASRRSQRPPRRPPPPLLLRMVPG
jgi:hypothetical protein